jgi:hypothetical protein
MMSDHTLHEANVGGREADSRQIRRFFLGNDPGWLTGSARLDYLRRAGALSGVAGAKGRQREDSKGQGRAEQHF